MSVIGFILMLVVAAACAWIGEYFIPGPVPGGIIASAVIGLVGAWVGGAMLGHFGPSLAHISLLPTILGSAVLVFGFSLLSGGYRHRHYR